MVDVPPSEFTTATPTNQDADFIPFTLDKTGTPLDRTMSLKTFLSLINLLSTITDVNSDAADLLMVRQDSDGLSKDITIDNFFKGIHDLMIPASAFYAPTTEPATGLTDTEFGAAGHEQTKKTFDFTSTTADERIQTEFPMWRKWDLASFDVIIVWSHAAGTGNVRWGARATCAGDDDAIAPDFGTGIEANIGAGTNDDYIYTTLADVTPGGTPASADILTLEIYREGSDGGDTFDNTARLHHVILRPVVNKKTDA